MSVPARRTYMRADDRRAQILACARGVFGRQGFHKSSIADICAAAGIGRGTLYQYFGNKRAVFEAVLADLALRLREELDRRPRLEALDLGAAADVSPEFMLAFCRRRLRAMLEVVFEEDATLRLVVREARGLDGVLDEAIRAIDEAVLGAFVADLTAARDAGLVACPEPRLTALFVLGGIEKMVLAALAEDAPINLDRIVAVATQLQLFGLASPARDHALAAAIDA